MTLIEEIRLGETQTLEFKRIPNENRVKYQKTAVAFANGRGGRILFGVANDRSVIGIPQETLFTEMDAIVNSIADACEPKIPLDVCVENVDGKSVIVLDVFAGGRCPYYVKSEGEKDGVYVRVGATTRVADDATRYELALASMGRSFDKEPCANAKIDDGRIKSLCSRMYRIARSNCRNEAERRTVKRVTPEQLQSWGIVSQSHGKWIGSNAYALLTGDKAFPICVRCGVFKGDDKAVFVDRRQFEGSVCDLIDESLDYILAKINMGCDFVGARRRDNYELPPDALRELIVNAFVHRNYFDHNAPVFVAVYDTRVEISSPGGLPRGLSKEEALAGRSCIRNHALAAAFNYMHYVEGWGSGFKRVNEQLAEVGVLPATMEVFNGEVRLNVRRKTSDGRVSTEELPIDEKEVSVGGKKVSFGTKEVSFDGKKVSFGAKEVSLDAKIQQHKLTRPTAKNIQTIFAKFGYEHVFGRAEIAELVHIERVSAGKLLRLMSEKDFIVPVTGHGKGKYRFKA